MEKKRDKLKVLVSQNVERYGGKRSLEKGEGERKKGRERPGRGRGRERRGRERPGRGRGRERWRGRERN